MMARNQKLAPRLVGRAVVAVEPPAAHPAAPVSRFAPSAGATWTVRLNDGSALAVRTDGAPPQGGAGAVGGHVADVTQRGTTLTLALADGKGALVFHTAEASGCVLLRGSDGGMLYAD